jgi:hypothetical protein
VNPGGATLSGTRTVTTAFGVAAFADLTLDAPGSGYTLLASAPDLTGVESIPFDVTTTQPAVPIPNTAEDRGESATELVRPNPGG